MQTGHNTQQIRGVNQVKKIKFRNSYYFYGIVLYLLCITLLQ